VDRASWRPRSTSLARYELAAAVATVLFAICTPLAILEPFARWSESVVDERHRALAAFRDLALSVDRARDLDATAQAESMTALRRSLGELQVHWLAARMPRGTWPHLETGPAGAFLALSGDRTAICTRDER
jgi:hypothetical protein